MSLGIDVLVFFFSGIYLPAHSPGCRSTLWIFSDGKGTARRDSGCFPFSGVLLNKEPNMASASSHTLTGRYLHGKVSSYQHAAGSFYALLQGRRRGFGAVGAQRGPRRHPTGTAL